MRLIDADKLQLKLLDMEFPIRCQAPILDAMDDCAVITQTTDCSQFCGVPVETAAKVLRSYRYGETAQLPCRIGQKVWLITNGRIAEAYVHAFLLTSNCGHLELLAEIDLGFVRESIRWDEEFGETLFLTVEEAETELRRI